MASLSLRSNQLTGPIASSTFSSLVQLQRCHLSANFLSGPLPRSLNNLHHLQVLHLHTNALTGAVPDLKGLHSLRQLELHDNLFQNLARTSKRLSRQLVHAKVTVITVNTNAPPSDDAEMWRV